MSPLFSRRRKTACAGLVATPGAGGGAGGTTTTSTSTRGTAPAPACCEGLWAGEKLHGPGPTTG
eukprot:2403672-Rhodomonas_salina.2